MQNYLRYSKRVILVAIISWVMLCVFVVGLTIIASLKGIALDNNVTAVLKNVMTCASSVVIATASGYYAHSSYEKKLKALFNEEDL